MVTTGVLLDSQKRQATKKLIITKSGTPIIGAIDMGKGCQTSQDAIKRRMNRILR